MELSLNFFFKQFKVTSLHTIDCDEQYRTTLFFVLFCHLQAQRAQEECQVMQGLMDGLVHRGLKAALELQAGKEYQDLLGTLDSKVSLVQRDILDIVETRYTINLNYYLHNFRHSCLSQIH